MLEGGGGHLQTVRRGGGGRCILFRKIVTMYMYIHFQLHVHVFSTL